MKSYRVNVDRGVQFDPLTGCVMDMRGETGAPFVHVELGQIVVAEEVGNLVERGFLVLIGEPDTPNPVHIEFLAEDEVET